MLLLFESHISWNKDKPWPPEPDPYIELARVEEFVEPEPVPLPQNAPDMLDAAAKMEETRNVPAKAAPESGTSIRQEGKKAEPAKTVTTPKPAKAKEVKKEQPKDKGAAVANKKPDAENSTAARTRNNVKNAFAKPDAKSNANNRNGDTGLAGNKNGREDSAGPADSKSLTSGVQHGRVSGGWLWPNYTVRIRSSLTGSIVLRLVINRKGEVTEAHPSGGRAPAASDVRLQQQCIAIAKSRNFTRSADAGPAPDRATATLTFTFK